MTAPAFPAHRIFATIALALLVACTAPAPQADAGVTPEPAATPSAPVAETPPPSPSAPPEPVQRPAKPPRMSDPLPPQRVKGEAAKLDHSCRSDADCAVKNVGNCCGYYPACVNKDSPTDPEAVMAQCAKSGMASVCGFAEISACTCDAGQCTASGQSGLPARR